LFIFVYEKEEFVEFFVVVDVIGFLVAGVVNDKELSYHLEVHLALDRGWFLVRKEEILEFF